MISGVCITVTSFYGDHYNNCFFIVDIINLTISSRFIIIIAINVIAIVIFIFIIINILISYVFCS